MKKLFNRFRRKLMIEAILKAFLMGALIASCIEFVFLFVMHLLSRDPGWVLIGCVFAAPFLLSFLLFFCVVYYPTQKRIAKRLDQSGLEERAGTMLEFMDGKSTILELQRADAVQRIKDTSPKQIHFRIAPKVVFACVIAAALSVGSMFVPYNIMAILRAGASSVNEAEAEMVRGLLAALRKATDEAEVRDELKEQLYDGFDQLESDLSKAEGELEKAAKISEAEIRVKDTLSGEISKDPLGSSLRKFGAALELGKAIESGNTDDVSAELARMKSELLSAEAEKKADRIRNYSSVIAKALSESGVTESDQLYTALNDLVKNLDSAASANGSSSELENAFEKGKEDINSALEEQKKPGDLLDELLELLRQAKKDILNADYSMWETEAVPGENPDGETANTEQNPSETEDPLETQDPNSEKDDQSSDRENDEDQNGDSQPAEGEVDPSGTPSGGNGSAMREEIYDPSLGNVEYGQVFAAYYADYLASIADGAMAGDIQEMLEKYFESLNK